MRFRGFTAAIICLGFFSNSYALTEFDADSIVKVMKRVANYRMTYADIANLFNHDGAHKGDKPNGWAVTNQGCSWDVGSFMTGLMAMYYTTKDTAYLNFAKRWATNFGWNTCYNDVNATSADNMCCSQTYTEIYMLNPVAANANMISNVRANLVNYFDKVKPNPPYSRNNGWWWCDALFMAPPAMTRFCKASGENRFLDTLNRYWWSVSGYLYDSTYHFYYRDDGFFPAKQNGKHIFWSGGNAWVIGGLARVLDYMPKTYANRAKFESQFKDMCTAILSSQGHTTPYDGMWTTDMLNHTSSPGVESIGTAFFCYAFAWGVRNGLLDSATYTTAANKAWRDLNKNIGNDGRLLRCQHVDWGPNTDQAGDSANSAPEGEGAFLLAGWELYMKAKGITGAAKPLHNDLSLRQTTLQIKGTILQLTVANPQSANLSLFSMNGKLVADLSPVVNRMKGGTNSLSLQSLRLAPGVYSAVLRENGVTKTAASAIGRF